MIRTNRLVAIMFVAAFTVLTDSADLMAAHILSLDASRTGDEGEAGPDRYLTSTSMTNATNVLTAAGFTIGTTNRFTAANTAGANVLFTGAVDTAFTAQELTDITAFVSAGGGLVLMRDWDSYYPAADPLAATFGATYNTGAIGSTAPLAVNQTVPHSIWSGPAGSVATYNQVFSSSVSGVTGIGYHSTPGSKVGLAYTTSGLGRVVFLTDMDAWDDLTDSVSPVPGSNNGIVWENIFHYAAPPPVPEPSTLAIWSLFALCGIGYGWRRRKT